MILDSTQILILMIFIPPAIYLRLRLQAQLHKEWEEDIEQLNLAQSAKKEKVNDH